MSTQTSSGLTAIASTAVASVLLAIASTAHAQPKPALVRDLDRPTAQPVHGSCNLFGPPVGLCTLYTVPAGKRLTVETVSYSLVIEGSQQMRDILFGDASPLNRFGLGLASNVYAVTPALVRSGEINVYAATQPLKFYLDEGESLAGALVSGGTLSYSKTFSFSGYLTDK